MRNIIRTAVKFPATHKRELAIEGALLGTVVFLAFTVRVLGTFIDDHGFDSSDAVEHYRETYWNK